MADNKHKKPFLKKGEGKLVCHSKKLSNNKKNISYLKSGRGKLAWQHNESKESLEKRESQILINESKKEIIIELENNKENNKENNNYNIPPSINDYRKKYKNDNENFIDTIEARIKMLESKSVDKFNYTY
jgi:hypothetical protein